MNLMQATTLLVTYMALAGPAHAATVNLPATGQTSCFNAAGASTACAGTGQDGAIQAGVAWSDASRFTLNTNGTITDNLTGLVWLKQIDCIGAKAWSNAVTSAGTLASGQCGLTDGSTAGQWRIPSRNELMSLASWAQEYNAMWLNNIGFTGGIWSPGIYYWSSTTCAGNTTQAWAIDTDSNAITAVAKAATTSYAWPVRAGL